MRLRQLKVERLRNLVFVNWRGKPLYIFLVFLLGQIIIDPPIFLGSAYFVSYITQVTMEAFVIPTALALLGLIALAFVLYYRYSPAIRRFLEDQINGEFSVSDLATTAWQEAVTFPQRVISGVIVACLPIYGLLVTLLAPQFGFYSSLIGGLVAVTSTVALSQVIYLFYLEWAMSPVARLALTFGALPSLADLKGGRLRLRTKLLFLISLIVVLPVTVVGLFGYSRVVMLGVDPTTSLRMTGIVAILSSGLALLLALLLVRSLSAPVREVQRVMEQVGQGNLNVFVNPLTTDELAELGFYFNRMVEELREQERLKIAFSQYVSESVRDGILSGTISLGGERRDITILFTDIRGFTRWCEQEPAESVIQTLNVYYGFLIQALTRYGGTVTRYTGDGVLALFGAPLADSDHALHAVQASLEADSLLTKFNDIRRTLGAFELHTGFGIHSGDAVVGSIGTEERAEYTPIGDAANVASRIEGLNRDLGTTILVSDITYQRIAEYVQTGQQTEVTVKGRSQPVRVVEVVGLNATPRER